MRQYSTFVWFALSTLSAVVSSESYYSIIAPGVIKSNRKYTVAVTLHEADAPTNIKVNINGPSYQETQEVSVQPYETKKIEFEVFKLAGANYTLTAESTGGIKFRQQSEIVAQGNAGPKIYIQTDRAIYKPGDLLQFRVVMLDEHTRPLKIREPIRVEILDGKQNRIKQFKDIRLTKGVYTGKLQISKYPVMGKWQIIVTITGNYDHRASKQITIDKYVLPKFSVYLKGDRHFVPEDGAIKVSVYGKYTFDKYVEGNVTAVLVNTDNGVVLQEKRVATANDAELEFRLDNPKDWENIWDVRLEVELEEKYTGLIQKESLKIAILRQRYSIAVDLEEVQRRNSKPYSLKAKVTNWNGSLIVDRRTPVTMQHGAKEYSAYLDGNSEALFEFDHDPVANHIFKFKDSVLTFPNIYADNNLNYGNETKSYCRLRLLGDRPRLGSPLEVEVSSMVDLPYLVYIIVSHGDIVQMEHVKVAPNQKVYTIQVTPSIEMVPKSILYVHYIQNGILHYDEMELRFPKEFENQISIMAPKEARPGQEVTIDLKAQRKAYVGILAVDLSVYLLDPSYDLKASDIWSHLEEDQTYLPFGAKTYPGLLSGVLTLTNAQYPFEGLSEFTFNKANSKFPSTFHKKFPETPIFLDLEITDDNTQLTFRKKFPETWIFQDLEITDDITQLTLNVPDTITTWRLTAFSVHEVTGFGIVHAPTDIVAIKPFFVHLNLPYSVKTGEIIAIPITVFNYHNQSVDVDIVLYNQEQEFEFVDSNLDSGGRPADEEQCLQRVHVPTNGIANVGFSIKPKKSGDLSLRITAENALSADALLQKLRVEPEGVAKHENKAFYISVPPGETFRSSLPVNIPGDSVPSSEYVSLSVGGDTLVPTLDNLNDLVLLPTGCGEQNMVNFAPNILVLNYLRASRRYSKEKKLVSKANEFIEIGYQQQLSYRHRNGGYSVFGEAVDEEPSSWLTAYTIRFFIKAEQYVSIEANIIESGLEFLASKQTSNGDFPNTGYLFHPAHQNRFGFTAFVLMTFLENEKYAKKYQSTIEKSLDFLNNNLGKVTDLYALSIMANALQMAKHVSASSVLDTLREQQRQLPGLRWWSEKEGGHQEKDIEITAYILMAQLDNSTSDATDDLFILKWLIEQRNERGGFQSTHDTVVGLQALVRFSKKYGDLKNINMQIQYSAKDEKSAIVERNQLTVDADNVLALQTEELPKSTRSVDIQVTGSGFSLLQLSYRYHMIESIELRHFQIEAAAKILNPDEILLEICLSYRQATGGTKTNMIILEANLPSGFTTSDANSFDLLKNESIQRLESKNSETTLVIYFDKLSAGIRHCVNILADKVHDVMMLKPAAVVVYDYYNMSRSDTAFYNI